LNGWRKIAVSPPSIQEQFDIKKLRRRRFPRGPDRTKYLPGLKWKRDFGKIFLKKIFDLDYFFKKPGFSAVSLLVWQIRKSKGIDNIFSITDLASFQMRTMGSYHFEPSNLSYFLA
jgi:hypothetical protein